MLIVEENKPLYCDIPGFNPLFWVKGSFLDTFSFQVISEGRLLVHLSQNIRQVEKAAGVKWTVVIQSLTFYNRNTNKTASLNANY